MLIIIDENNEIPKNEYKVLWFSVWVTASMPSISNALDTSWVSYDQLSSYTIYMP